MWEYLALEDGPPWFPQDYSCPEVLREWLRTLLISITGLSPSLVRLSRLFFYNLRPFYATPTTPLAWFGLLPVRSPLLRESRLISSPSGTEMFHFPEFASWDYLFIHMILDFYLVGSPIQVSTNHKVLHLSSWLFAVSHAFLRLHMPRHPPIALTILSLSIFSLLSIQLSTLAYYTSWM